MIDNDRRKNIFYDSHSNKSMKKDGFVVVGYLAFLNPLLRN